MQPDDGDNSAAPTAGVPDFGKVSAGIEHVADTLDSTSKSLMQSADDQSKSVNALSGLLGAFTSGLSSLLKAFKPMRDADRPKDDPFWDQSDDDLPDDAPFAPNVKSSSASTQPAAQPQPQAGIQPQPAAASSPQNPVDPHAAAMAQMLDDTDKFNPTPTHVFSPKTPAATGQPQPASKGQNPPTISGKPPSAGITPASSGANAGSGNNNWQNQFMSRTQHAMAAGGNAIASMGGQSAMGPGIATSAAAGALSGAAYGGGIGAATGAVVSGLNAVSASAKATAENLGKFSAQMSMANAKAEVRQITGDIKRADFVAPEVSRYTEATSKIGETAQNIQAAVLKASLEQLVPIIEQGVDFIEKYGEFTTEVAAAALTQLDAIVQGLAAWKVVPEHMARFSKFLADTANNLKDLNDRDRNRGNKDAGVFMEQFLEGAGLKDEPGNAVVGAGMAGIQLGIVSPAKRPGGI